MPDEAACALCERTFASRRYVSGHHLLPRSKGGGPEHVTPLCSACHTTVHHTFTNATLAQRFHSIEALRSCHELGPYLRWVRKQDPHRRIRSVARRRRR